MRYHHVAIIVHGCERLACAERCQCHAAGGTRSAAHWIANDTLQHPGCESLCYLTLCYSSPCPLYVLRLHLLTTHKHVHELALAAQRQFFVLHAGNTGMQDHTFARSSYSAHVNLLGCHKAHNVTNEQQAFRVQDTLQDTPHWPVLLPSDIRTCDLQHLVRGNARRHSCSVGLTQCLEHACMTCRESSLWAAAARAPALQ